jgi:beta-galactosidase
MTTTGEAPEHGRSFAIGEEDFLLDGEPFRILSGAIHYFRVHPDQWSDRIRKARLMGLNTIETYVAWNAHEPTRGAWDASGWNDLGAFLDAVAAEGMLAIVRPGPYICAEWANGGLPVWLTGDAAMGLRTSEPRYLEEATRYLQNVYEIVEPRQIDRGGNVILVQIENEYGAYGSDKDYLRHLVEVTRAAGIDVPLTTVDQPQPAMLRDGSLEGIHLTGSFGSSSAERLQTLREHQPTGPLMSMEFWDGWFDWWGGHHHTTSPENASAELETLLAAGASVNFYMFHGGTNFGLTNGANDKGRYLPITTSYDYDAPLDEAGNPTAKYFAFREVISRYAEVPDERPDEPRAAESFDVALSPAGDWTGPSAVASQTYTAAPTFDELSQLGGLIRYEVALPAEVFANGRSAVLEAEVRDFAWVRVDGAPVGSSARTRHDRALAIPVGKTLTLLVEDEGRVNYDSRIGEMKGLIGAVCVDGIELTGWSVAPIDLDAVAAQTQAAEHDAVGGGRIAGPVALRGSFTRETQADLFLETAAWGRGYAFVNGFHLGRYRQTGPQRTLYVPGPVTRVGVNNVVILELEYVTEAVARFVSAPLLGPLEE